MLIFYLFIERGFLVVWSINIKKEFCTVQIIKINISLWLCFASELLPLNFIPWHCFAYWQLWLFILLESFFLPLIKFKAARWWPSEVTAFQLLFATVACEILMCWLWHTFMSSKRVTVLIVFEKNITAMFLQLCQTEQTLYFWHALPFSDKSWEWLAEWVVVGHWLYLSAWADV